MIKNLFYKKLVVKLANGNKEQMIEEIYKMSRMKHKKIQEIIDEAGAAAIDRTITAKEVVEFICKQLNLNTDDTTRNV